MTDNTYTRNDIDPSSPNASSRIVGGQFIPGGPAEGLIASGDGNGPLKFYVFDGVHRSGTTLINATIHCHLLQVGDIDLDGNLDFFTAEMGKPGEGRQCTAWVGWGNSAGDFQLEILSVGIGNHESKLSDLDGDGDLDIAAKPYRFGAPRIDVFLSGGLTPTMSLDNQ